MPEISRFYGIIVKMFYADHPPKHFHVEYNEYNAIISIESLEVLEGKLPVHAQKLIKEWGKKRKNELQINWELASRREMLNKIEPLE